MCCPGSRWAGACDSRAPEGAGCRGGALGQLPARPAASPCPSPTPPAPSSWGLVRGASTLGPTPATPRDGWDQDPACPCTPLSGSQAPAEKGSGQPGALGIRSGVLPPQQEEGHSAQLWLLRVTAASRSFAGTWRTAKRQRRMEANTPQLGLRWEAASWVFQGNGVHGPPQLLETRPCPQGLPIWSLLSPHPRSQGCSPEAGRSAASPSGLSTLTPTPRPPDISTNGAELRAGRKGCNAGGSLGAWVSA